MTRTLAYRVLEERDTSAVLGLWAQTEWGEPHAALRRWYAANPCAGSFVMIAENDSGIVGQIVMMGSRVHSEGRDMPALCALAPIIGRELRDTARVVDPRQHPVIQLYHHAVLEAQSRGMALIYSMPHVKWIGLFRRLPNIRFCTFPLWSVPLPLARLESIGDGYSVSRLWHWDDRVDRLWTAASRLHGCAVVRDARVLQWKLGLTGYLVLKVERSGELVGVVAAHNRDPRQWTVCDVLACDAHDTLRATLQATCNFAHLYSLMPSLSEPVEKVSLLVTPALESVAASLGFVRDDYDSLLVVRSLDPTIPADAAAPERWYVSINDHG